MGRDDQEERQHEEGSAQHPLGFIHDSRTGKQKSAGHHSEKLAQEAKICH
ncbi:MAG: hypothetical protein Fur0032_08640 [Terrimicrobiaceae bacterium]